MLTPPNPPISGTEKVSHPLASDSGSAAPPSATNPSDFPFESSTAQPHALAAPLPQSSAWCRLVCARSQALWVGIRVLTHRANCSPGRRDSSLCTLRLRCKMDLRHDVGMEVRGDLPWAACGRGSGKAGTGKRRASCRIWSCGSRRRKGLLSVAAAGDDRSNCLCVKSSRRAGIRIL